MPKFAPVAPTSTAGRAILRFASGSSAQTVTASKLAAAAAENLVVTSTSARATPELFTGPAPTRDAAGIFHFSDTPAFTPNLSPAEVLRAGSFGGCYFRTIASTVTGRVHAEAWRELPVEWLAGVSQAAVSGASYDAAKNAFKVKSGADLDEWESSGWITAMDPFGWFQWYTRFFQGRRSWDDERQISRWAAVAGDKGRWRRNLIAKVVAAGAAFDDASISPVVRQTLQHWGLRVSLEDLTKFAKTKG